MKRLLALILCLGLLTGTVAGTQMDSRQPAPLDGAGNVDWGGVAFRSLQEAGVVGTDMSYMTMAQPAMGRGRFASYLALCIQKSVPAGKLAGVSPVASDYFADGNLDETLTYAVAYGILEGRMENGVRYGDLNRTLTREQAAKMVCSAMDFVTGLGYLLAPSGAPAVYTDASSISPWAAPYTGRISAYQIMVGDEKGRFLPQDNLSGVPATIVLGRFLDLVMTDIATSGVGQLRLESKLDWSPAAQLGRGDFDIARPWTGYRPGYYTVDNGDGTLTGVVAPPVQMVYDPSTNRYRDMPTEHVCIERYDSAGKVVKSWTLPVELPIIGAFFAGKEYNYIAYGQRDMEESGKEVYRIVQYDKEWNRLGASSVNSRESYTTEPYCATISRMDESADGSTLILHAARQRYLTDDGLRHQSNITIQISTRDMRVQSVSDEFPDNHVSHSFGQFIRFDGNKPVYVDHGDAYPRSIVLQTERVGFQADLLAIAGESGDNVTNAIGSGLEVSDSNYLFLGCSIDQRAGSGPWNVFLSIQDKAKSGTMRLLTASEEESIDTARLVKVDNDTFVAMWEQGGAVHYQQLDGAGASIGAEKVLKGVPMPPSQPVVQNGAIRWIQFSGDAPVVYTLELDG